MSNYVVISSMLLLASSQNIFIVVIMLFTRTDQAGTAKDYRIVFDYPKAEVRDVSERTGEL